MKWLSALYRNLKPIAIATVLVLLAAHAFVLHFHPFAPSPAVPDIDVPAQVQGQPGHHVEILAVTKGSLVRWHVAKSPVAPDLLQLDNGHRVIFTGTAPGRYDLWCWSSIGKVATDAHAVAVYLGQTPPAPPGPGPAPGPTPAPVTGQLHVTAIVNEDSIDAGTAATVRGGAAKAYCDQKGWVYKVYDRKHPDLAGTGVGELADASGVPALVVQDAGGHPLPDGKAAKLPATEAALLALLKQYGG